MIIIILQELLMYNQPAETTNLIFRIIPFILKENMQY